MFIGVESEDNHTLRLGTAGENYVDSHVAGENEGGSRNFSTPCLKLLLTPLSDRPSDNYGQGAGFICRTLHGISVPRHSGWEGRHAPWYKRIPPPGRMRHNALSPRR
jgi:hypothetical protein